MQTAAPPDSAVPRQNNGRTISVPGCWEEESVTDCYSRYFAADCDQRLGGRIQSLLDDF